MNNQIMEQCQKLKNIIYEFYNDYKHDYLFWEQTDNPQQANQRIDEDISAMNRIVMDFYASCCEAGQLDDFVTLFAMYCNLYIQFGLSCVREATEDNMFGLYYSNFENSGEETFLPYLKEIYAGITTQEYFHFEDAVAMNSGFSVANLYLFVKNAVDFFWFLEASDMYGKMIEQNSFEGAAWNYHEEMMKYYKRLSPTYREYALSRGEYCIDMSKHGLFYLETDTEYNALPRISFMSDVEKSAGMIVDNFIKLTEIDYEEIGRKFNLLWSGAKFEDVQDEIQDEYKKFSSFLKEMADMKIKDILSNKNKVNYFYKILENIDGICFAMHTVSLRFMEGNFLNTFFNFSINSLDYHNRIEYLHLCNYVRFGNSSKSIEVLFQLNMQNEEIVQDFSHTYQNMRASQLSKTAESLMAMDDKTLKKYGRQILLEYSDKQNRINSADLLRLRHEKRNDEILRKFRQSVSSQEGYDIKALLGEAFRRVLITLFYDNSEKGGKWLRKAFMESEAEFDLIMLMHDFESQVLFQKDVNAFDWFCEHVFPISLEISGIWKDLFFYSKENHASTVLIDILTELTTNLFRFGNKEKSCCFVFCGDTPSIITVNDIDKKFVNLHGDKEGLHSIEKIVDKLNKAAKQDSYHHSFGRVSKEYERFVYSIFLEKSVFQADAKEEPEAEQ